MCACLLWAGCVGFLWANEPRLVFRSYVSRAASRDGVPGFIRASSGERADVTRVHVVTADGLRLEALRLDARSASAPWIVFFHGSGHSIYHPGVQAQLAQLHALGYGVLAPEYRGFGRNPGTASEAGLYEDAVAAYEYMTGEAGVEPERVVLAGRSLGSAVAVELATRVVSAGLVLFSPIDSVPLVGARLYPWVPVRYLASNRFDAIDKIGRVKVPLLIVHARGDDWVPIDVARALFARASTSKLMLETTGNHNGAGFRDVASLQASLEKFWPVRLPPLPPDPARPLRRR
jgi:uncharacterized protein